MTVLGILVAFETTEPEANTKTVAGHRTVINPEKLPMFRDWGDEDATAKEEKKRSLIRLETDLENVAARKTSGKAVFQGGSNIVKYG